MESNKKVFFSLIECYQLDDETNKKYNEWNKPLLQNKVHYITALTAILYFIYAQIDMYVAPEHLLNTMLIIHLYILVPTLIIISAFGYYKKYFRLMIILLMIAPAIAALGNLMISIDMQNKSLYLTEIYLIIFWIFTVSGLSLKQSLLSASSVVIIAISATYFLFSMQIDMFVMHVFWIVSSFSFGFLTGYLLERYNKVLFLKREELKKLAITDKLTGLYNREKLDTMLLSEIDRCKRFGNTFGFIIVDIDNFKLVNDTYGHQVGDKVLIEVSNIIKKHTRSIDIAFRWGGEEFIIIYLEVDKDKIIKLSEKLRIEVQNYIFELVNQQTISIGATIYQEGDNNISLTKRADTALYESKDRGRNCTNFL